VVWDAPRAVLAPVNGRVLRVFRESAGPIEMGQPILEMADLARMEIVADALTADAVQIEPGASARITGWGGEAPLEARVRLIEPAAFTRVSALGVEEQRVHVILDMLTAEDARPGLGDGFRVQCRIVIYQAEDALKVPSSALFREGRDWAVFLAVRNRAEKRIVQLARRNPEEALLRGGLQEGDEVILFPGESIRHGARIER
jgi:HlyD family secretion protein